MTKRILILLTVIISMTISHNASAQVETGCSSGDCGTVQIPANDDSQGVVLPGSGDMPPASEAGQAPGGPIEN